MGFFDTQRPVILKESSSAPAQLTALESLQGKLPRKAARQLEDDIRALRAGIAGEERVLFELRNSHIPMVVLQDLWLEHQGLTAQIDFLVLTQQRFFVIECKNLYGNIEVNERGDFVRTFGGRKREGFYSPVTQNQRHIELIHDMKRDSRGTLVNLLVDRDFSDLYQSLVVLANPKTVIDDHLAPRDVRDKIVRVDQLITKIKSLNAMRGPGRDKAPFSTIQKAAEWFLERHGEGAPDYTAKYRELAEQEEQTPTVNVVVETEPAQLAKDGGEAVVCPRCGAPMVLRVARRGAHAGEQFYGCSRYPQCRGILSPTTDWRPADT